MNWFKKKPTPSVEDSADDPSGTVYGVNKATPVNGSVRKPLAGKVGLFVLAATLVSFAYWVNQAPPPPPSKDDPNRSVNEEFKGEIARLVLPAPPPALPASAPPSPRESATLGTPSQPPELGAHREEFEDTRPRHVYAEPSAAPASRPMTALEFRLKSSSVIINKTGAVGNGPGVANAQFVQSGRNTAVDPAGSASPGRADPLGDSLRPTVLTGAQASLLTDRRFLLTAGTVMPCIRVTAFDSTLPSLSVCKLATDIFGEDRTTVLFERGTKVIGQAQGGMRQGQKRVPVLWTQATTPTGVRISVNSPSGDALGRGGESGFVDTHFYERFGAALWLSLIDDGLEIVSGLAKGGRGGQTNNTLVLPGTTEAGKNAAAIAVENSVNIPPTLNINQAQLLTITVQADMDFSSVYAVEHLTRSR